MTTTPDSRIRADFSMEGSIATDQFSTADIKLRPLRGAQPTKPIDTSITATPDTSTTAGKVAVMQAAERGKPIQMMTRGRGDSFDDDGWSEPWCPPGNYNFNWERYDYRIAPPPAPRTALQAARERAAMVPPTGGGADNSVRDLLKQIDNSIVVTIEPFKFPHYGATKLEDLQPGRYRLVRDDAP